MSWQEVLKYVDDLWFVQTQRHLDSLQMSILQGVFDYQKYAQIAEKCNCTEAHIKDEAYELWQKLSKTLGEDVNKSNFRATIERNVITNSAFLVHGNRIGSINFCPNSSQSSNSEDSQIESNMVDDENLNSPENLKRIVKLESVANLYKLGLTAEQISQALGLSLDDVKQGISR